MIEEILPETVVVEEARCDLPDAVLFEEEEKALGHAVEKRRLEFTTGRACARLALARLGLTPVAIPAGARGEPRWPAGVVGSITHCNAYRACAVGRASEIIAIGIDAEPNEALPDGVLPEIALPEELPRLRELRSIEQGVAWDRLLFSAKEAVYKVWFPLAERWLGFHDAKVIIDRLGGTFSADLLVPGPSVAGAQLSRLQGRWIVRDELVITAIVLRR